MAVFSLGTLVCSASGCGCGGSPPATCATAGYGCCSGSTLAVPTTLYASICGSMGTLTAYYIGSDILGWTGVVVVPSSNVAALTACDPGNCPWDGVTTVTGTVALQITLFCNGSSPPLLGCVVSVYDYNVPPDNNWALVPSSCPGDCTGVGPENIYYGSGCPIDYTATSGTWGSTVSITGANGTYISDSLFGCVSLAGAACAGDTITITS